MLRAILFNDTSFEDHHGCQVVVRQIKALAAEAGIQIEHTSPVRYDWSEDPFLLKCILKSDLCIVNGEGTMHDDAPAALLLARLAGHCKTLGIPCVLINSVWQNNHVLDTYAEDFTQIYVRDELSRNALERAGINSAVVPDLTLTLRPPVHEVCRSGLILNGSVLKPLQQQAWVSLNRLSASSHVRYLSIRTVPPLRLGNEKRFFLKSLKANGKMLRHLLSSRLQSPKAPLNSKSLGRLRWRYSIQRTDDFLRTISAAEGVITGRFHMVTLCMVTKTPFMALGSNTHKIEGLLMQAKLPDRLCQSYDEGLAKLPLQPYSELELVSLQQFLDQSLILAKKMFANISELPERKAGH